jgi:hypothetical protein
MLRTTTCAENKISYGILWKRKNIYCTFRPSLTARSRVFPNIRTASQEILRHFWNPKVCYRDYKNQLLSQYPGRDASNPHPPTLFLILSSHLHLGLLNGLFSSGQSIRNFYAFLISPMFSTCPAHPILRDLIIVIIFGVVYSFTDLFALCGIRRNCHSSGRNLLLYQLIKRVIRLIVIIIEESPSYQLPTKFYPTFFCSG